MKPQSKASARPCCSHFKLAKAAKNPFSLKTDKENGVQCQFTIDRLTHANLRSERRNRTKHESVHDVHKYSRNAKADAVFSKDSANMAGHCIKNIEEELVQLKKLAGYELKTGRSFGAKCVQCVNFEDAFTQTADNADCKQELSRMKSVVAQMKERMEELETIYRRDGKKIAKLERMLKEAEERLERKESEAEKYKVSTKMCKKECEGQIEQMKEIIKKQRLVIRQLKEKGANAKPFSELPVQFDSCQKAPARKRYNAPMSDEMMLRTQGTVERSFENESPKNIPKNGQKSKDKVVVLN